MVVVHRRCILLTVISGRLFFVCPFYGGGRFLVFPGCRFIMVSWGVLKLLVTWGLGG